MEDFETIAQEVSGLGQRVSDLEERLEQVEHVNTGLEEAALSTARALQRVGQVPGLHGDAAEVRACALRARRHREEAAGEKRKRPFAGARGAEI